ncbi:sialidase family protein [Niallia taxi]|uniref:sialidase family protein n=1 Tax=Niallia taxi TaxID=2499688 RepID=UPI002041DDF4|nr:sialidase family protein [Niallia taxi]MCM3213843.1 exo-alpha-sialidase [Niallia taxi]
MSNNKLVVNESIPNGKLYHDDYTNIDFSLIPSGPFPTAHAPTIIKLENGDLLCAWFAGSFEGSPDISIVVSKFNHESQEWNEPKIISQDDTRSEQNPSFFHAPDKSVWLIYTSQEGRQPNKDNMQFTSIIKYQKTYDNGENWTEPEVLFSKPGVFARQTIQVLSNGRWIFSTWVCEDSELGLTNDPTVFQVSDDEGLTWKEVRMPESNGRVHANVIELEVGHLVAFMRSRFADNIYRSESTDYGDSWTVPEPTILPNNNSSISAIKLNNDAIAIAYNANSANNPEKGKVAWPGLRNPVVVSVSEDGGNTWPIGRIIEFAEGYIGAENKTNNSQFEYPTIYQDGKGILHLVYAYKNRLCVKYNSFSIEDIYGEKRENEGIYNPTSGEIS